MSDADGPAGAPRAHQRRDGPGAPSVAGPALPHIRWVEEQEADGDASVAYRQWLAAHPERDRVPDILKCFSLRPDFFRQVVELSQTVHFADGHLSRRAKEAIATLVSGLNQCPY